MADPAKALVRSITSGLLLLLSGCAESAIDETLFPDDLPLGNGTADAELLDGGSSVIDATLVPDATTSLLDATTFDSATPNDASKPDGSSPDSAVSTPDSSVTPADASLPDAARDAAPAACEPDKCTNSCGISSPVRCCKSDDTCGCTWVSGIYCT